MYHELFEVFTVVNEFSLLVEIVSLEPFQVVDRRFFFLWLFDVFLFDLNLTQNSNSPSVQAAMQSSMVHVAMATRAFRRSAWCPMLKTSNGNGTYA